MSYDIDLCENSKICSVDRHYEGGTHCLHGTEDAHLNVTYNYNCFYRKHVDEELGIRWIYGKTGEECAGRLEYAVSVLGTERDDDYWKPTAGNAGYALSILLGWAKQHPNAVFSGD